MVALDRSMTIAGTTHLQLQAAERMQDAGIPVLLCRGEKSDEEYRAAGRTTRGFYGILHAKSLLIVAPDRRGATLLVGSCNWTTSSRANIEHVAYISINADYRT